MPLIAVCILNNFIHCDIPIFISMQLPHELHWKFSPSFPNEFKVHTNKCTFNGHVIRQRKPAVFNIISLCIIVNIIENFPCWSAIIMSRINCNIFLLSFSIPNIWLCSIPVNAIDFASLFVKMVCKMIYKFAINRPFKAPCSNIGKLRVQFILDCLSIYSETACQENDHKNR